MLRAAPHLGRQGSCGAAGLALAPVGGALCSLCGISQSGLPCWSAFAEVCLDKAGVCARQSGLFSKSCLFPKALFGGKDPRCQLLTEHVGLDVLGCIPVAALLPKGSDGSVLGRIVGLCVCLKFHCFDLWITDLENPRISELNGCQIL